MQNPFYDNDIKFLSTDGAKLPDDIEEAIESEIGKALTYMKSSELGAANWLIDAASQDIEFLKGTCLSNLNLNGLNCGRLCQSVPSATCQAY